MKYKNLILFITFSLLSIFSLIFIHYFFDKPKITKKIISLVKKDYNCKAYLEPKNTNPNIFSQNFLVLKDKNILEKEIKIPENINFSETKVEINFSNNLLSAISNIIKNYENEVYDDSFYSIVSKISKDTFLIKNKNIFSDYDFEKIEKNLSKNLEEIEKFQKKDGGFSYNSDCDSDYYLTNLFLKNYSGLKDIKKELNNDFIEKSLNYLENIYKTEKDENVKAEIFYILKKYWKKAEINFEKNNLNKISFLNYNYWLFFDLENNKKEFYENLDLFIKNLSEENEILEKSILTSLLIDLNDEKYKKNYEKYILEIYEKFSEKNDFSYENKDFILKTFLKYLEKNNKKNYSVFWFSLWKHSERKFRILDSKNPVLNLDFKLSELEKDKKLKFKTASQTENPIFINIFLKK